MTDREIDELLADIISSYALPTGRKAARKTALKLPTFHVESNLENINGDAYMLANTALGNCGKILEEDRNNKMISGVIYSGTAKMNPAFVELQVRGKTVHIRARAKEGLIKQHTAQRAIEMFTSALNACYRSQSD